MSRRGEPSQLVVVELDRHEYAIPLECAVEVLRIVAITPVPGASPWMAGVVNLRGTVTPMVDLRVRLGLEPNEVDPSAMFVVARVGDRVVGLLTDRVVGVVAVPAHALELPHEGASAAALVRTVARSEKTLLPILDLEQVCAGVEVLSDAQDGQFGDDQG
jgi:purine-binding chemotaxis protein CheW